MNFVNKLKKWELVIEKKPKYKIIQVVLFAFIISLFAGFCLSQGVSRWQKSHLEKVVLEMKKEENQRMQKRLKDIYEFRYAQK